MGSGAQTVTLGEETFAHSGDAEPGLHTFSSGSSVYRLREWTWAEKNAASNASVVLDPETGGFRIDAARFNEAMLSATLLEATVDGRALEISPAALRGLKASLGDRLLGLAQWVNGMLAEAVQPPAEPRFDPRTEMYELALGQDRYRFREWTWGEKNDISNRSVVYDPAGDGFRVNVATFNEGMLQATLVEAPFEVTLENLRRLPASQGDALLGAAQWVSRLAATEKKSS